MVQTASGECHAPDRKGPAQKGNIHVHDGEIHDAADLECTPWLLVPDRKCSRHLQRL